MVLKRDPGAKYRDVRHVWSGHVHFICVDASKCNIMRLRIDNGKVAVKYLVMLCHVMMIRPRSVDLRGSALNIVVVHRVIVPRN